MKKIVFFIISALLLGACSKDVDNQVVASGNNIMFTASSLCLTGDETRGTVVDNSNFQSLCTSFGAFGCKEGVETMVYDSSLSLWKPSSGIIRWPEGTKKSFYAFAPYPNSSIVEAKESGGSPIITFTVSQTIEDQQDLLVAKKVDFVRPNPAVVPLEFKHALTAIAFEIGEEFKTGKIESITLKNICKSATYNLSTETWGNFSEEKVDFQLEINKSFSVADAANNQSITELLGADKTLFMLPQTFTDEASVLEVKYYEASTGEYLRTFSAPLKDGKKWEAGKRITYQITPSLRFEGGTFTIDPIANVNHEGGEVPFKVTSDIRVSGGGVDVSGGIAPWSWECVNEAGEAIATPAWLNIIRDEQTNNGKALFSPNEEVASELADTKLQHSSYKGSAGVPYNLSNQTGGGPTIENTANTYVINSPGYYSLPLVYGNGIKEGVANPSAYEGFYNHTSIPFGSQSTPYLKDIEAPKSAEIVWQYPLQIVGSVSLDPISYNGCGALCFDVPEASIRQGNAVIAVKDAAGAVMWSWHIWITPYKLGDGDKDVYNRDGSKYTMMPINLGWIETTERLSYTNRSVRVKFIQEGSNKSRIVTLTQQDPAVTPTGYDLHYQWGRKDPIPDQINGVAGYNFLGEGQVGLEVATQHPGVFYRYRGNWTSSNLNNLWGDVKTIYDPSPVGYQVPDAEAFSAFALENNAEPNASERDEDFDIVKGWDFYCKPHKDPAGGTLFFPALGNCYYADGVLVNSGECGFYWNCNSVSLSNAYRFQFQRNDVLPSDDCSKAMGQSIRSIKTK